MAFFASGPRYGSDEYFAQQKRDEETKRQIEEYDRKYSQQIQEISQQRTRSSKSNCCEQLQGILMILSIPVILIVLIGMLPHVIGLTMIGVALYVIYEIAKMFFSVVETIGQVCSCKSR